LFLRIISAISAEAHSGADGRHGRVYGPPRWRWALALVLHLWSLPLPAVLQVEKARSLHI
jgi:hypothetical protein